MSLDPTSYRRQGVRWKACLHRNELEAIQKWFLYCSQGWGLCFNRLHDYYNKPLSYVQITGSTTSIGHLIRLCCMIEEHVLVVAWFQYKPLNCNHSIHVIFPQLLYEWGIYNGLSFWQLLLYMEDNIIYQTLFFQSGLRLVNQGVLELISLGLCQGPECHTQNWLFESAAFLTAMLQMNCSVGRTFLIISFWI